MWRQAAILTLYSRRCNIAPEGLCLRLASPIVNGLTVMRPCNYVAPGQKPFKARHATAETGNQRHGARKDGPRDTG